MLWMVMMGSLAVPIIHEEKFLGVVGVDITLNDLQNMMLDIKPMDTVLAKAHKIRNNAIGIALISLMVLGLIIYYLVNNVTNSIERTTEI